jgi:hypothetical protein
MPHSMLVEKTPLETLVISQIEAIRKRESALQERLARLSPQAADSDQINFAEELWHLQRSTDRLNRMMDAMCGYSSRVI